VTDPFQSRRTSIAAVLLFAALVNYPCLIWGLQTGGDRAVHISYLASFDQQLRAGDPYPQWLNDLNYGAGSPIFFVQYPLPYYLSTAIRALFLLPATLHSYARAIGLFLFLTGILSAAFTWLWCERLSDRRTAGMATLIALTMPYVYGFDLYYRGAIGEYWALAWIPLALFFAHDLDRNAISGILGISLSYASILLAHPFSALLFAPFLVSYAFCVAEPLGRWRTSLRCAVAVLLGMGLSGFYLFPMFQHRLDFDMSKLVRLHTGNFYYQHQLFPYGQTLFPSFRLRWTGYTLACVLLGGLVAWKIFQRLQREQQPISLKLLRIAVILVILITCLAPVFHFAGWQPHQEQADPNVVSIRSRVFLVTFVTLEAGLLALAFIRTALPVLELFLGSACLLCFFLTTRWSEAIWHHARLLWNLQFPWRFDGLLTVFTVGLIALAIRDLNRDSEKRWLRSAAFLLVLWVFFALGVDFSLGIAKAFVHPIPVVAESGLEIGFPTYTNVESLPSESDLGPSDGLPNRAAVLNGNGSAKLTETAPRQRLLVAVCAEDCTVLIRQVYFPFWHAVENGRELRLKPSSRAGLSEVSLPRGSHQVRIELLRGRPELAGLWSSVISGLVTLGIAGVAFFSRSRKHTSALPVRQ
jgi:hypothetical protein